MKTPLTLALLVVLVWGVYLYREQERQRQDVKVLPAQELPPPRPVPSAAPSVPATPPAASPVAVVKAVPAATVARQNLIVASTPKPAVPSPAAPAQPPPPEILPAIVTIAGHDGAGTGFLCSFRGKTYVATNQHVLEAGFPLVIRTGSGESLTPRRFFAADDADIVLIECVSIPAIIKPLEIATLPNAAVQKDNPTMIPGNSKGDGVITQTPGKLLAIGPQRVEVDNPVYPGNSGSPIIDLSIHKVVGILTQAELVSLDAFERASFNARNSAIKSTIRYFGLRIDSVQRWTNLDLNAFQQSEEMIKQSRRELDAIFAYFTNSSDSYKTYRELHEARNNAALIINDRKFSNADKSEAYSRFLRDIESMARKAKMRLENHAFYYIQRDQVGTVNRMSDAVLNGTAIVERDQKLAATLLDRVN